MNQILSDGVMLTASGIAVIAMLAITALLLHRRDKFGYLAVVFDFLFALLTGYYISIYLDTATPVTEFPMLAILGRPAILGICGGVILLWVFILRLRGILPQ